MVYLGMGHFLLAATSDGHEVERLPTESRLSPGGFRTVSHRQQTGPVHTASHRSSVLMTVKLISPAANAAARPTTKGFTPSTRKV